MTENKTRSFADRKMVLRAVKDAFLKLAPRTQAKNPVMLLVYISAILTTVLYIISLFGIRDIGSGFTLAIAVILWLTVLFANFAEAIAEGRGKAQADVAVAMNSGTQAAKEAGNMVDLDSSPTKLIDIVRIGKQLLMTRGSLTTFSIANDVAKYFAIIPAIFMTLYPGLSALNIMQLASPSSAILSAIIYNALIIVALIPLALRGVKYREVSAGRLLSRNLLLYGLGGIVTPFVFIKLIDMVIAALGIL